MEGRYQTIPSAVSLGTMVVTSPLSPLSSLIMLGSGLLMVGIGLIGIAFAVWIVCKVFPKIFVWFVDICSGIIHKK